MFFKEFDLPIEPKFNDLTVNVFDFGAVADNQTDVSVAVNKAIDYVSEQGGGRVVIPEGTYFSTVIKLKSNVDLHLDKGAQINFSDEPDDYLPAVFTRIEGVRCYGYSPLIYGVNLENVAITGEGTFNGNGEKWWDFFRKTKVDTSKNSGAGAAELIRMAKEGIPVEERNFAKNDGGLRPYFLQILYSKNILIEGVKFINSPFWCVAPTFSENVIVRNVTFNTTKKSHNTDSVDIDSCKNCLIEGVVVESSSDDCVVIKSGRDRDGLEVDWPTENVLVRNCKFKNCGAGCVIGSETSGGIRNVYMHDCECIDANKAVGIKSAPGRGNVVENIDIENVTNTRGIEGVSCTLRYFVQGDEELVNMPKIRNISIKNVDAGLCWHGFRLRGYPNAMLENIHVENLKVDCIETTTIIENVDGLHLNNIEVKLDKENWFDWATLGHTDKQ